MNKQVKQEWQVQARGEQSDPLPERIRIDSLTKGFCKQPRFYPNVLLFWSFQLKFWLSIILVVMEGHENLKKFNKARRARNFFCIGLLEKKFDSLSSPLSSRLWLSSTAFGHISFRVLACSSIPLGFLVLGLLSTSLRIQILGFLNSLVASNCLALQAPPSTARVFGFLSVTFSS